MENSKLRKFLLLSRYNEKRFLQEIEPCVFKLVGDLDYLRVIFTEDGKAINAIDPTGGPFISVGSFVKKDLLVKSIEIKKDNGDILIYTEN